MKKKTRLNLFFSFTIGITALGLSSAVFAIDPFSSRYGETGAANKPRFDKQWWEVDENGNPPTMPRTNDSQHGSNTDCRTVELSLKEMRARIGDEVKRYTRCLERADSREDCGRDFDVLKRVQQDQEDAVHAASRTCR